MIKEGVFGELDHPKYSEYVNDINGAARHLLDVISDILDLSKIESGEAEVEEVIFDVADVISDARTLTSGITDHAKIVVINKVPGEMPQICGDRRMILQCVANLLSNAIKYTPPEGRINLEVKLSEEIGIHITITDTGPGIAAEDIEHIQRPFAQVRGSSMVAHKGTGLGLPIVKNFCELHDGRFQIVSQLGEGTSASLQFPGYRTILSRKASEVVGGFLGWRYDLIKLDEDSDIDADDSKLVDLWLSRCRNLQIPTWEDFSAAEIAPWSERINLLEILTDPFDIKVVKWGALGTRILGYDRTGTRMGAADIPGIQRDVDYYKRLSRLKTVGRRQGPINWQGKTGLTVSYLDLPISNEGRRVDGFISLFNFSE